MESFTPEVAPFGMATTVIEPGLFRRAAQQGLDPLCEPSIEGYRESVSAPNIVRSGMSGQQGGDTAELARGVVQVTEIEESPARWVAVEGKADHLLAQVNARRDLPAASPTTS